MGTDARSLVFAVLAFVLRLRALRDISLGRAHVGKHSVHWWSQMMCVSSLSVNTTGSPTLSLLCAPIFRKYKNLRHPSETCLVFVPIQKCGRSTKAPGLTGGLKTNALATDCVFTEAGFLEIYQVYLQQLNTQGHVTGVVGERTIRQWYKMAPLEVKCDCECECECVGWRATFRRICYFWTKSGYRSNDLMSRHVIKANKPFFSSFSS